MLKFEIDKDIATRVLCKEHNIVIDITHYYEDLEKAKEIAKFIVDAPELLGAVKDKIKKLRGVCLSHIERIDDDFKSTQPVEEINDIFTQLGNEKISIALARFKVENHLKVKTLLKEKENYQNFLSSIDYFFKE